MIDVIIFKTPLFEECYDIGLQIISFSTYIGENDSYKWNNLEMMINFKNMKQ